MPVPHPSSPEQARNDFLGSAFEVTRNISQNRLERPERKHLVVRHCDVVLASGSGRHPDMAPCLARLLVTQYGESFPEVFT
jgi:hypothetical protein